VRVLLDDDEVSSDDDAPLQKRLRLSSDAGGSSGSTPSVPDVAAAMKVTTDREATDRRATEEATVKVAVDKEATDKRAAKEVMVKEVVDKEATDKRATEEAAVKDSSATSQAPSSAVGTKGAAVPSGSNPSAKRPYRGIWKPRFV
jgi:hypothetical protein